MSEYIDGLLEGSHKLTPDQFHAWAKASRKRVYLGKIAESIRKASAKKHNCKEIKVVNSISNL
tara:strand:+ start:162 stop:350 length:189 start_codon:yes stop_codon:yes gene_type:complete